MKHIIIITELNGVQSHSTPEWPVCKMVVARKTYRQIHLIKATQQPIKNNTLINHNLDRKTDQLHVMKLD